MTHGKTQELILFSRQQLWRTVKPFEKKERDRSLRGKARIKARKGR